MVPQICIVTAALTWACTSVPAVAPHKAEPLSLPARRIDNAPPAPPLPSEAVPEELSSAQQELNDPPDPSEGQRPVEGLVQSDACLAPLSPESDAVPGYLTFVRAALDLTPGLDVRAALITRPSFDTEKMLTLRRRKNGNYFVRLTTLSDHVWRQLMMRMRELQASTISLDEHSVRTSLADIHVERQTIERDLDWRTGNLIEKTWKALIRRTQFVREVGFTTLRFDGTQHEFWTGTTAGTVTSPEGHSVLGHALLAAEWLEGWVENPSSDDQETLQAIRAELGDLLKRTEANEPCLRPLVQE